MHLGALVRSVALGLVVFTTAPQAREIIVGKEDYTRFVRALAPGDDLKLTPGMYREGLVLHGLHGTDAQRIVIEGPDAGAPAIMIARDGANTVSFADSSYITVRNIRLDGAHLPVDAVKAEGGTTPVHHITLENLTIINYDFAQDVVAISTKSPAWGWAIRDNLIVRAGTGLYLGDSDGTAPFFDGLIEGNVIIDSIGYNIEIKHQIQRPPLPGASSARASTVLRNNLFSKSNDPSTGAAARPNVLLGHSPLHGTGSGDRYEVSGNTFIDNASEALFQGEGNLLIAGNVFFNSQGDAIVIQPHHDVPRRVLIDGNFVAARGTGISIRAGAPDERQEITNNAVYAATPLLGGVQKANTVGAFAQAWAQLKNWRTQARDIQAPAVSDRAHLASMQRRVCKYPRVDTGGLSVAPLAGICAFLRDAVAP